MAAATEAPLEGAIKFEETEALLQDVLKLFSVKEDATAVKDAGRAITELHAVAEHRHREMLESVKGAPSPH